MSTTETSVDHDGRSVDRPAFGLAAFLAVAGVYVIVDAASLSAGFSDQYVPPYALPYLLGTMLVVLAVCLAVATARGSMPEADAGEDVDLTVPTDWRTIAMLVGLLLVCALLIDLLSWAIVGAFLFAGVAAILGSRTFVRDLAVGALMSVGSWYGFYVGLGIPIPAGILDGVL